MNFFKKVNISVLIYSIILIALGICLVAMPHQTLRTICYIVGGVLMALGVCSVVGYFVDGNDRFGISNGIIEFLFGLILVIFAVPISDGGIFAIFAGVALLISGIYKAQNSFDIKMAGIKQWWVYLLYAVMVALLGLLLIINPFEGQDVLLIFLGVTLIFDGIMDIVVMCILGNKVKHIKEKFFSPIIVEPKEIKHEDKDKNN